MGEQEREDVGIGLTDMVLDAEPAPGQARKPEDAAKPKDQARDPARDGAAAEDELPLAGQ